MSSGSLLLTLWEQETQATHRLLLKRWKQVRLFFDFGHLNIRRNKESEQLNRSRSGREKKRCGTTVQLSVLLFIHHHSIIALFTYVKYHWRNESA